MWDYKTIRKNVKKTTFRRGFKAWIALIAVCLIFVLVDSPEIITQYLYKIDQLSGAVAPVSQDSMAVIDAYLAEKYSDEAVLNYKLMSTIVNFMSQKYSWLVNFLASNYAYFQRNSGEVITSLLAIGLLLGLCRLVIIQIFDVGKSRYALEAAFQKKTRIRRAFSPFHRKFLRNELKTMLLYNVALFLWSLTIVGYPIKYYQYSMIPYLLAENPQIPCKEAFRISKKMTQGYKWKMFLTDLSFAYLWLLHLIPMIGPLLSLPMQMELGAVKYLYLRRKETDRKYFIEHEFDRDLYVQTKHSAESFLMEDTIVPVDTLRGRVSDKVKHLGNGYLLTDYIVFFFAFSFVGWAWEVLLYIVRDHMLVNRGTLYGPWLPIYGCGGVVIIFLLGHFKGKKGKLFVMGMLLCGVIEYIASWVLDYFFNKLYWEYYTYPLNVNGRICLVGLTLFGIGGLVSVYIAGPRISVMLDKLGKKRTRILCCVLVAAFIADLICVSIFGFNTGNGVGTEL